MTTIPTTPPRKSRIDTPNAPLYGPTHDRPREKKKSTAAAAQPPSTPPPATSHKSKAAAAAATAPPKVSFALSPPGSPDGPGSLFDNNNRDGDVFGSMSVKGKGKGKYSSSSSISDPFTSSSGPSSSRFKKFKPPPASQMMKNPFAPEPEEEEEEQIHNKDKSSEATSAPAGYLPTPAKTPSRKRKFDTSTEPEIEGDSTTRVLFSESVTKNKSQVSSTTTTTTTKSSTTAGSSLSDSLTLESILGDAANRTPTTTRKKQLGRSNDIFGSARRGSGSNIARDLFGSSSSDVLGAPREAPSIEIYTDSNARVPEYDPSPDNPFIDHEEEEEVGPEVSEKVKKSRKKFEKSRQEFERVKGGRDDGMVYTFRGMKVFRKFEEDTDEVLGSSIQPRVLFPSARKTRTRGALPPPQTPPRVLEEEAEEEAEVVEKPQKAQRKKKVDADAVPQTPIRGGAHQSETEEDKADSSTDVDENAGEELDPFMNPSGAKTKIKTPPSVGKNAEEENSDKGKEDEDKTQEDTEEDKDEEAENEKKEEDEKEDAEEGDELSSLHEKPTRAASVAPSVSSSYSVASSSNIMTSFGRRPRITKSVSNLSSSCEITKKLGGAVGHIGSSGPLRRSKRLASVEPEVAAGASIEEVVGKVLAGAGAAAHHRARGSAKRGRSPDAALEHTERWAHGVSGGIRKRYKN